MNRRRVVITGMGAVTPLGNNVLDTWQGLIQGKSGVDFIRLFDASTFATQIAGEVKNLKLSAELSKNPETEFFGRNSRFALEASYQALSDSRLGYDVLQSGRMGVYFGAGDGGFDMAQYASIVASAMDNADESLDIQKYMSLSRQQISSKELVEQEPSSVVYHLSRQFGIRGNVFNSLTACAASSQAIGEATQIIRAGYQDVMLAGGAHSMIHPLGLAGFILLTALSTHNQDPQKASRPFDKNRDGFVLAEGSAALILEEYEHAKKRGAKIYAEIAGYGTTADAYRMTDPHADGRGAQKAISLALEDASLDINGIDYINAHGTSTGLNDQVETLAIKKVFGEKAKQIPISSIKSMLGHMIAAAGATELVASVLTIENALIPPTINYETPDEDCDLDYVPNRARKANVKTVLSNSFGFGGQNVALIVKKFEG